MDIGGKSISDMVRLYEVTAASGLSSGSSPVFPEGLHNGDRARLVSEVRVLHIITWICAMTHLVPRDAYLARDESREVAKLKIRVALCSK